MIFGLFDPNKNLKIKRGFSITQITAYVRDIPFINQIDIDDIYFKSIWTLIGRIDDRDCVLEVCNGSYDINQCKYHFIDGYLQNLLSNGRISPAVQSNTNYIYIDNQLIHNINGPAVSNSGHETYYYQGCKISVTMFKRINTYKQLFDKIINEIQYLTD